MNLLSLNKLTITNFGPFESKHVLNLSKNGLFLVKGRVIETEDGSGSGKSYLLKAIAYLFGGCTDPGTEIQSWFTDEAPEASVELETSAGVLKIARKKGLSISGGNYKEAIKGKAAEAELDKIFGMDADSRAVVTYRGQGKPGLFLSLSDDKKKVFLSNLLGLDVYYNLAEQAKDNIGNLEKEQIANSTKFNNSSNYLQLSQKDLAKVKEDLEKVNQIDVTSKTESVKSTITENKNAVSRLTTEIDKVRKETETVRDAVLLSIQTKLNEVYKRPQPLEVQALVTEIEKEKTRLQKALDFDKDALFKVEQQRTELRSSIKNKQLVIFRKSKVENEIKALEARKAILEQQKCSECKREWVGPESEKTLANIISSLENSKKELESINATENEIKDLSEKLSLIQNPIPHPVGKQTAEKIQQLNAKLKETAETFEKQKQIDSCDLQNQLKDAKQKFEKELSEKLGSLKQNLVNAQNALECAISEDKRLSEVQSQQRIILALYEERQRQVKSYQDSYTTDEAKVLETDKKIALEKDIIALVGRQGFLGTIFEEVLVEISAIANNILSQIANVQHLSIDFETEKESATGNITSRIVPVIYSRGRKVSFKSGISGGMQTAVMLAVDLAVGEVVSRRRGSYPGWLILDESFDGLGGTAKESCIEMLKNYANDRLVLIVDHDASFQGLFNDTIQVEQTDGRSRIVN